MDLDRSYCQYAIISGRPLVVTDARVDPLVADSLATGESGIDLLRDWDFHSDADSAAAAYFPTLRATGGYDWQAIEFPPADRSWSLRLIASVPVAVRCRATCIRKHGLA